VSERSVRHIYERTKRYAEGERDEMVGREGCPAPGCLRTWAAGGQTWMEVGTH